MIFHCSAGMCICNVIIHRVTRFLKCPVQQFKVHHIIDNNRTLPLVTAVIPGTDTTNCWLIAGNQCSSRFQQDIFVVCIIGQAITVTKADDLMAHEIVVRVNEKAENEAEEAA